MTIEFNFGYSSNALKPNKKSQTQTVQLQLLTKNLIIRSLCSPTTT
jgi:hypothetical protein